MTTKEQLVRCNNCMAVYVEHEYELVFECSKCETEDFLMDLTEIENETI